MIDIGMLERLARERHQTLQREAERDQLAALARSPWLARTGNREASGGVAPAAVPCLCCAGAG